MKLKLSLLRYYHFIDAEASLHFQVLHQPSPWLAAEESNRFVWSDRRAHLFMSWARNQRGRTVITWHQHCTEYSAGMTLQHIERGISTEVAEQILDIILTDLSEELCWRRFLSLFNPLSQNRKQKSSLYKETNGLSVSSFFLQPPYSWHP